MGMLEKVVKGKIKKPHLVLIWGQPGVGKSSFAADFPSPIFIGAEDGTSTLDVARFPEPKSYSDIRNCLAELGGKHAYKTVVLDSLDWIEPLVFKAVCDLDGSDSIDKAQGSYGKGYTMAIKLWRDIISDLTAIRETGMNVVLIAHSHIKAFNDPNLLQPYDKYMLKINDKAAAIWVEYCDAVLFATYETFIKADKDAKKTRAMGDGKRILFTEWRPGFTAKNRLNLPFELPLSYAAFEEACGRGQSESVATILSSIRSLSGLVTDTKTLGAIERAVTEAGKDAVQLKKILNRLRVVTGG